MKIQIVEVKTSQHIGKDVQDAFKLAAAERFGGTLGPTSSSVKRIARGVAFSEAYHNPGVAISHSVYHKGVVVCPIGHMVDGKQSFYAAWLNN